ncbi:XRE family transcriptional regulator [Corynebacterium belfantii]|uniref:XRE family transcriptional regulator n=1 Tax=Corynebacterium belfantii TaxID=2014537 RepID=UPI00248C83BF|nr:XRE family transcriptional regulator [Corynebacterium belfantii]
MFLISLDELERVKRLNRLRTAVDLAEFTGISRNTWNRAIKDRKPTHQVLQALEKLGAAPDRVLVKLADEELIEENLAA